MKSFRFQVSCFRNSHCERQLTVLSLALLVGPVNYDQLGPVGLLGSKSGPGTVSKARKLI